MISPQQYSIFPYQYFPTINQYLLEITVTNETSPFHLQQKYISRGWNLLPLARMMKTVSEIILLLNLCFSTRPHNLFLCIQTAVCNLSFLATDEDHCRIGSYNTVASKCVKLQTALESNHWKLASKCEGDCRSFFPLYMTHQLFPPCQDSTFKNCQSNFNLLFQITL